MKESESVHRESAPDYDRQAEEWGWRPEVFFGLMWEFVQPGQTLLDAGIGTGLCSVPFHKANLKIYGMDGADDMLQICAEKNVAVELKQHDLLKTPWPYPDEFFHHIICGGVFHFFGDLQSLFSESARILKEGGTFGFTTAELKPAGQRGFAHELDDTSGTKIYHHSKNYILKLLHDNRLVPLKELVFLASVDPATLKEHFAKLYVTRKESA